MDSGNGSWKNQVSIEGEVKKGSDEKIRNQDSVDFLSPEWWVKTVGMLRQNWAVIHGVETGNGVSVFIVSDVGSAFDKIDFKSMDDAEL